jgi:F-type H+-transporting ATPase subunit a
MDKIKAHISDLQPQLISIALVTMILVIVSIVVYIKVQKVKPNQAPSGIALIAEQYVMGVDNLFKSVAQDKINPVAPYIFTLLSFLLLGNVFGLIGFEPPTTSYSVPLTLGLVA